MRIVQVTAGTGSFHCGTCLRDNALVRELRTQGHDALLVPVYLPPTLDEPDASPGTPLFFGGVNVYLQQKSGLFRRTPRWVDRVFDSPAALRAAAKRAGMTRARDLGEITLSTLRGEEGRQVKELERLAEWLAEEVRPHVVCLSNTLLVGLARRIKERTGAAVACAAQGEDSYLDSLPESDRAAAWALLAERARDVDAFLPVSRYYAGVLASRAGIPDERMHVVYPGIDLSGYGPAPAPRPGCPAGGTRPPVLGFLARMCRTKGLDVLVEAFLLLRARGRLPGLRLRVAGSQTEADARFVAGLRERLAEKGLAGEAEFLPNVDREGKIAFLRGLSALSVPATYGESFGLYVIEALAAGVPVVQPRHAAFPELVEATGGGVLYDPGDPGALAAGVEELLLDPARARALGLRGMQAVRERFGVERMAREAAEVFRRIAPGD